jgi:surface polysaccharide O-acyltransferase-like enzyme
MPDKNTTQNHILYLDILRISAILAVITLHVSAQIQSEATVVSLGWLVADIANSLSRWCVPVFLMVSGALMLDPSHPFSLSKLFKKHILTILIAYFGWGIIYYLPVLDLVQSLKNVLYFNTHYHLGFLQYLLGLYLLSPVLRIFVAGAKKREWIYFFVVWVVVSGVFPVFQIYAPGPIKLWFQTVPYKINFNFFMNYTGFYLAGYWLNTALIKKNKRIVLYILGALGGVWTIAGTRIISAQSGHLVETFYEYGSLNVIPGFNRQVQHRRIWQKPQRGF